MNQAELNRAHYEKGQLETALRLNEAEQAACTQEVEYLNARNAVIEDNAQSFRARNKTVPSGYQDQQEPIAREIATLTDRLAALQTKAEAIRSELAAANAQLAT